MGVNGRAWEYVRGRENTQKTDDNQECLHEVSSISRYMNMHGIMELRRGGGREHGRAWTSLAWCGEAMGGRTYEVGLEYNYE